MSSSNPIRAVLGLLVAGAIIYFGFFAGGYGSKVTSGPIEVYYKDGATKDEAERLAAYLAKLWADAPDRRSVQILKKGDAYLFRMVVKSEYHNDNKMLTQVGIVGARISRDVFNGAAIEVEACDDHLKGVKMVPVPGDFRRGILRGKFEVFYADGVAKADAEKLMAFVEKEFAAAPAPLVTVTLGQRAETRTVTMAFNKELLKQPEVLAELRAFRERISKGVFGGEPVELSTCDDSFQVTETFKP